jgi:hypothetical protein
VSLKYLPLLLVVVEAVIVELVSFVMAGVVEAVEV